MLAGAAVLEIGVIAVVLFWDRHGAASCKPVITLVHLGDGIFSTGDRQREMEEKHG